MKLYKIWQKNATARDTYDSAIVAAKNEDEAKKIHPSGSNTEWLGFSGSWVRFPKDVEAELIGTACKGTPAGLILASFNAG